MSNLLFLPLPHFSSPFPIFLPHFLSNLVPLPSWDNLPVNPGYSKEMIPLKNILEQPILSHSCHGLLCVRLLQVISS